LLIKRGKKMKKRLDDICARPNTPGHHTVEAEVGGFRATRRRQFSVAYAHM
jgi:hypothetical protein